MVQQYKPVFFLVKRLLLTPRTSSSLDVVPLSLGVAMEGNIFAPVVPRGNTVPTLKKRYSSPSLFLLLNFFCWLSPFSSKDLRQWHARLPFHRHLEDSRWTPLCGTAIRRHIRDPIVSCRKSHWRRAASLRAIRKEQLRSNPVSKRSIQRI